MTEKRLRQIEALTSIVSAFATLAVPIVVAIVGSRIQVAVQEQALDREYVGLAVSVLTTKDADVDLKRWAGEMLAVKSPIPVSDALANKLKEGPVIIPAIAVGSAVSRGEAGFSSRDFDSRDYLTGDPSPFKGDGAGR